MLAAGKSPVTPTGLWGKGKREIGRIQNGRGRQKVLAALCALTVTPDHTVLQWRWARFPRECNFAEAPPSQPEKADAAFQMCL